MSIIKSFRNFIAVDNRDLEIVEPHDIYSFRNNKLMTKKDDSRFPVG